MMQDKKRMVRYSEGALLYSMSLTAFQRLAKKAGAIYRIEGMPPLVRCDVLDAYIEKYKER